MKNSNLLFITMVGLMAIQVSCTSLPKANKLNCTQITTGHGPEDFVLDQKNNRILVSSHDRRNWSKTGNIYSIDIDKLSNKKMIRVNEPAQISFRPHGMDIRRINDKDLLYVITHGPLENDNIHAVHIYEIQKDKLIWQKQYQHKLFTSPNDIIIAADGGFFVSNDTKKRGSLWEVGMSLKNANIVYCSIQKKCTIAADNIAMPNGLLIQDNYLYVSSTREHQLMRFTLQKNNTLSGRTKIAQIPGGDNLFGTVGRQILVSSHPSGFKFMRHAKNKNVLSPSVIYQINPTKAKADRKKALYADSGKEISAASGAFIHGHYLYVSQVFEPFILRCELKKPKKGN